MPIRMEKDDPRNPERRRADNKDDHRYDPVEPQPSRKRGLPIGWILGGLFLIFKKPQWLVPILLILGLLYFLRGGFNELAGGESNPWDYQATDDQFSFGAELNEQEYDKAMVFEPLSVGSGGLPSRVSLEEHAPRVLHQGRQGSCSGWASAYGARTISYAQANGMLPDQIAFSPSFLYNQIALPRCQGAYLNDAMEAMHKIGSLPFRQFGYNEQTCQIQPDLSHRGEASKYRTKGYTRLTKGANNYKPDVYGIKQHLAQGAPVVIGMMVGQSFQHNMMGQQLWRPSRAEYAGAGLGGHAMCVVGYDDNAAGGAFRIMNSWGRQWGDDGYVWVTYDDFNHFTKEAYGIYPEGKSDQYDEDRLAVKFALVSNDGQQVIPLKQKDEIVLQTTRPVPKGTKFKIAVTNNVECYTYVFGEETNGQSYTLFPYTNKHSPYCGITGTRLFPKDYSMVPDEIGNKDYMAIVVSKKELNYQQINDAMNASREQTYMMRMVESMLEDFVLSCDFDVQGGAVSFNCDVEDKSALGMIIEIDKR